MAHHHGDEASCFRCATSLTQPLVCESCGILQKAPAKLDPFHAFGLAPSARVEVPELRKRLSRLSRKMHPDFFATGDAEARQLAERNTSELNAAFEILSDDTQRIDWLIEANGGPSSETERQMPQEFLMEVLEWNETLEGAREQDAAALAALPALGDELDRRLAEQREALCELLDPLPPKGDPKYTQARQGLNAVRYLQRALSELSERRLAQAKGQTAGPN